ncbi:MAG TPA: pilus assembly protein [Hellea balneolensis]|uniref:Pilus assembly protein n=1 Tax=Hellea balneolensis TaxID=287478 RepID=A0A7C5R7S9_9PROT|nr:pilus assembly protein [Hellea balneolensis]
MLKTLIHKTGLARIFANKDGVAAIEFAIIAPIMIALYMGLAEVSLLVTADRRVSHASSVVGDLATQIESLDEDDIEDIYNAAFAVLGIRQADASRVSIDLISFEKENDGTINEVGYAKIGTGWGTKYDPSGVSATLLNPLSGLVVARVKYVYHSPSRQFVGSPTLKETFMLKPRKSASVPFENGGSHTVNCTLTSRNGNPRASCN